MRVKHTASSYLLPPQADEFRNSYIIPLSDDPFAGLDPFSSQANPYTTEPFSQLDNQHIHVPQYTADAHSYTNEALDNSATLPLRDLPTIDENIYSLADDDSFPLQTDDEVIIVFSFIYTCMY